MSAVGQSATPPSRRWVAILRVLAVIVGAYTLTALVTFCTSLLLVKLGMNKVEAVYTASLSGIALYPIIAIITFRSRSVLRAWSWLIGFSILCGMVWILFQG